MARVTPLDVKDILDNCVITDPIVGTMIKTANKFINRIFADETTLTEDDLKEIERWLTAHLISISLQRTTTDEKLGDASATYAGIYGEGLKMTSYGQTVLLLDTSGTLAKLGKAPAQIYAVKRPY